MTISDYLKHPYGKGSAFSSSTKQKDELDNEFVKINEKILSKIYRYRDFIIYHVIIPSTKKETVNYDVVIEVETKGLHDGAANLEDLEFKVFSNCPSFIFTYANVFRSNGLLCDWLLPKYNKEVRTKAPNQRNQYGIVGLERSLYLALKHLHATGKTKQGVYQTSGKKISGRTEIINSVRTQQQIMDKVKEKVSLENNKNTTKAVETGPKFSSKNVNKQLTSKEKKSRTTMFTKSVKNMKETKAITKSKSVKTTKKI